MDSDTAVAQPPRENLVRGIRPGVELRDSEDGTMPTLHGRFAVFNEWTEINSAWEGNFLERVAPGAFQKTMAENRQNMRVLFDHGHDPNIGNKPLGPIRDLREDSDGAYYEVPMLDTEYNRELLPGLQAGLYGASFRFKVVREDFNKRAGESEYNPRGLPERTISEAKVWEFGPVTFPAYEGASAGVRSLTDDWVRAELFGDEERIHEFLRMYANKFSEPRGSESGPVVAPDKPKPPQGTSDKSRRETTMFNTTKDWLSWIESI